MTLTEKVQQAIRGAEGCMDKAEARAAMRVVANWLQEQDNFYYSAAGILIERELSRIDIRDIV